MSARRLYVPDGERRYLTSHWSVLADLRAALRTEPNVRLAVLFGSTARGNDGPTSDIDILVHLQRAGSFRLIELEDRLSSTIGRPVDLVRLSRANSDQTLMSEVIADGRVLVDRDAVWSRIAADPDEAREQRRSLVRHLDDYPRQLEALRFSTRTFGADFDLAEFAAAFSSDDPALYTRVQAIERALGRLQSYMAAMAEDGTKLAGLDRRSLKDREPKAQPAFEALRDAGVITKDLCRRLVASQKLRNKFEHDYVTAEAEDLHEAVMQVLELAPEFLDRLARWLPRYLGQPDASI